MLQKNVLTIDFSKKDKKININYLNYLSINKCRTLTLTYHDVIKKNCNFLLDNSQ